MAVTIRQVAAKAGVSPMTVSYVLRGVEGNYRPETRDKVLAAARELGYRGSALPEAMRSGTFNLVALVVGSNHGRSWIAQSMLDAVHDALHAAGKHLIYCKIDEADLDVDGGDTPRLFRQTHADGVLVNGLGETFQDRIEQALGHYPLVFLNAHRQRDAVSPDDYQAGRRAAEWLRSHGCRRPAYLSFFAHGHSSMPLRCAGFRDGCAGLQPQVHQPDAFSMPVGDWEGWVERLLDQGTDGIFCYCDLEAQVLCRALAVRGLGPDRPHVIVVSERPVHYGDWELPTLVLPMAELGRRGAAMLLRKLDGKREPQAPVLLPLDERA